MHPKCTLIGREAWAHSNSSSRHTLICDVTKDNSQVFIVDMWVRGSRALCATRTGFWVLKRSDEAGEGIVRMEKATEFVVKRHFRRCCCIHRLPPPTVPVPV